MLSIIISSYQPKYFSALEKNIAETIGVPYEIIKIDNPGIMGICEAYNKGANKATYNYLLFLHEDVLFHTKNWGKNLQKHLQNKETGIIGLAGSFYVPETPSGWHVGDSKYNFMYILQNNKQKNNPHLLDTIANKKQKVFAIDGVFLAMRKEVYQQFFFDKNLKGFHAYDTDISLRIAKNFENYIIPDILLEHFSEGSADRDWFEANIIVRKKIGSEFPQNYDAELEYKTFVHFLETYFKYHKIERKSITETFRFLPKRISNIAKFQILKKYYNYIKFRKKYNERQKV